MSESVSIARCPEHGLHGERTECFVCDGPVKQVAMLPVHSGVGGDDDERPTLVEVVALASQVYRPHGVVIWLDAPKHRDLIYTADGRRKLMAKLAALAEGAFV